MITNYDEEQHKRLKNHEKTTRY